MIKFKDLIKTPNPDKTKVKFNMNPGNREIHAWDLLLADDPGRIGMNRALFDVVEDTIVIYTIAQRGQVYKGGF